MLTLIERCASVAEPYGELLLPFDLRIRSRLRCRLVSGEEVVLKTERGAVLRGGDCLKSEDGRVVRVAAAPEKVMHVVCANQFELTRAAYLGSAMCRSIGDGYLRIAADHVLGDMLLGLERKSRKWKRRSASGAYGGHGHHDDAEHLGKIHQYETGIGNPIHARTRVARME